MSKILTFNGNVLSKNGFGLTFGGYVPPPLPSNTIQFQFSDTSYDPTIDGPSSGTWAEGSTWTRVSSNPNVWNYRNLTREWGQGDSSDSGYFSNKFDFQDNDVKILGANLDGVDKLTFTFFMCSSLKEVNNFIAPICYNSYSTFSNTGVVSINSVHIGINLDPSQEDTYRWDASRTFYGCSNLLSYSDIEIPNHSNVSLLFYYCSSLTSISAEELNVYNGKNVNEMFHSCYNVSTGIIDMYNYLSTKEVQVTSHDYTFTDCGDFSQSGTAELNQIPSDWGGRA